MYAGTLMKNLCSSPRYARNSEDYVSQRLFLGFYREIIHKSKLRMFTYIYGKFESVRVSNMQIYSNI